MAAIPRVECMAAVVLAAALACAQAAAAPWTYIVPAAGEPFAHPPLRAVELSETAPPDLREEAAYRGEQRWYGQLTYGAAGTPAVTVVLDVCAQGAVDLYLDRDRDLVIDDGERLPGEGPAWTTPLEALFPGSEPEVVERTVLFRAGAGGRSLRTATCGYLEGKVDLSGREHRVRRIDADANGRFSDPDDRLWVDLSGQGRWDPIGEQYLVAPVLVLGGTRYALRGDEAGHRLALEELRGSGRLELALPAEQAARLEQAAWTLLGADGGMVTLHGKPPSEIMPVGEYRVRALAVTFLDPQGGPAWNYTFAAAGEAEAVWHQVEADGTTRIALLDTIGLDARLTLPAEGIRPGAQLHADLRLVAAEGLVLTDMARARTPGTPRAQPHSASSLQTPAGEVVDGGMIGFG